MGKKLANAPVYYALVQVRFSTIPDLDDVVQKILPVLKNGNYPDYKREVQHEVMLRVRVDQEGVSPKDMSKQITRHVIKDIDGTSGYLLDESNLTFFTTDYKTFNDFSGELLSGLELLSKHSVIGLVQRVGMRYLNGICTKAGDLKSLKKLVRSELFGLAEIYPDAEMQVFGETNILKDDMRVVARSLMRKGEFGLPPDLQTGNEVMIKRFQGDKKLHIILDLDSFIEFRERYSKELIVNKLKQLHDKGIEPAFINSTTREARDLWDK